MTPNAQHNWAFSGTPYGELVTQYVISEEICKIQPQFLILNWKEHNAKKRKQTDLKEKKLTG
jgi:hypothetical protein